MATVKLEVCKVGLQKETANQFDWPLRRRTDEKIIRVSICFCKANAK
jgi:hypothetical protein